MSFNLLLEISMSKDKVIAKKEARHKVAVFFLVFCLLNMNCLGTVQYVAHIRHNLTNMIET